MKPLKILAIETSCDETAVSKVIASGSLKNPKFKVVANAVSSQINVHRPFGGVVPNLAKREHEINLPIILEKLNKKGFKNEDCDLIAITVGPGLEPALWAGIVFAQNLAKEWRKPLIGVNHMAGHLYSPLLPQKNKAKLIFPAIALIVSGGHTIILNIKDLTHWKKIGETVDDAVGEAFDKVARLLDLPYPGGPEIEKLAKEGNPKAIDFPRPMLNKLNEGNFDFSFAGLKTSVLYYIRDHYPSANKNFAANVAASFQQACVDVLVKKSIRAAEKSKAKSIILCGGVAANNFLRETLKNACKTNGLRFFNPAFEYNTDNATMIAAAAYIQHLQKKKLPLKANGNLSI